MGTDPTQSRLNAAARAQHVSPSKVQAHARLHNYTCVCPTCILERNDLVARGVRPDNWLPVKHRSVA